MTNDLKTVRDALERWDNQGVINHDQMCSFIEFTRSALSRMIETPAPTEKVDLDALKRDLIGTSVGSERSEAIGWNACIDHLFNTGRLR